MTRTLLAAVAASLMLVSAAGAAGLTAEDLAKAKALTEAFRVAMEAGDAEALAALYAEDALLMPPNAPVIQGRKAILAFWEKAPRVSDVTLQDIEMKGCADLIYTVGMYSMTVHVEGMEPFQDDGKYLDVKRKMPDGTWQYVADTYNTSIPADQ